MMIRLIWFLGVTIVSKTDGIMYGCSSIAVIIPGSIGLIILASLSSETLALLISIRPYIIGLGGILLLVSVLKMLFTKDKNSKIKDKLRIPKYRWAYNITGKQKINDLDCESCGASLDHSNFHIEGGQKLIYCGHCKSLYKIIKASK